ncbi:DUF4386 domain-containing protein [Pseudofrankia sp. BMG5.37]|nr:DUF4386 domain-containing protein [Pseudofrankia sp. BMG5.37]MDT3446390.1 DUF4386 domain-containing protein [Pseudofrankia sp. BMG5.37]
MTANTLPAIRPVDASQRRAARVVGFLYLFLMVTGAFAQIYVPGQFPGGADGSSLTADTVRQIVDDERLLRLGAAVDVLTNAGDVALAAAYYVLLRPVSRGLAVLGAFWRVVQAAIVAGYAITTIVVLQLVSGADEVRALTEDQAAALAWVATSSHQTGYSLGFVFLGLGSTVFAYLLFRSGYVPRPLAAWGIFSSALLTAGSLITIVFPGATSVVNPALYAPMFIFEVTTGLWLLIRGIR